LIIEKFVVELIRLTGSSKQLAITAWYSLSDEDKKNPVKAANSYADRYNMRLI